MNKLSILRHPLSRVLLLWWCGPALASGIGVDCVRTSGVYAYLPTTTVSVGRNAAVNDPLGTWITVSAPNFWTCTHLGTLYGTARLGVSGYAPYLNRSSLTLDGITYSVYSSDAYEFKGLGYIMRWRAVLNGQTTGWQAMTGPPGIYLTPAELLGSITYNGGTSFPFGFDVQVRYVKRSTALSSGLVNVVEDLLYAEHYRTYNNGASSDRGSSTYVIAQQPFNTLTLAAGGTCTTPDVNVSLPSVSSSSFSGVGTTGGAASFNLAFNNCPAGLGAVGYSFAATGAVLNASQGVVALSAGSTATGLGLQLLSGTGVPVSFGTDYVLSSYDNTQVRSYTVPMQARLYQSDNTVTPGTVGASVTFTLSYR
jgi:major type 1 subunit fimbrin (pilin)